MWFSLVGRDRRLLLLLAEHQVLTTEQIAAIEFTSLRRAQDRLRRLRELGVVFAFRDSYATGGTSQARFALGYLGARMIAARQARPSPTPKAHAERLERLALWPKLSHHLGVNEFFCGLAAHRNPARADQFPDAGRLTQWWPEKRCAEVFWTQRGGSEARIRPDGYGCWEQHGRVVRFFLEHDTGTESLKVVARKVADYGAFPADQFGVVLFSLHSARRETAFRATLARFTGRYDPGVVIATTARDLVAPFDPAGPVWASWTPRTPGAVVRRHHLHELPERGPCIDHRTSDEPYSEAAFAPGDPGIVRRITAPDDPRRAVTAHWDEPHHGDDGVELYDAPDVF